MEFEPVVSESKRKHDLSNILFRMRAFLELLEAGAIDEKALKELIPGLKKNLETIEKNLNEAKK